MGINDEYSRDAYLGDHYAYDSDGSDDFDQYIDDESWQDLYSEELLFAWEKINEFAYDNYLIFDRNCNFPNFVGFVMDGSKSPPKQRSFYGEAIWNKIKDVPAISDRVQAENFYSWFDSQLI